MAGHCTLQIRMFICCECFSNLVSYCSCFAAMVISFLCFSFGFSLLTDGISLCARGNDDLFAFNWTVSSIVSCSPRRWWFNGGILHFYYYYHYKWTLTGASLCPALIAAQAQVSSTAVEFCSQVASFFDFISSIVFGATLYHYSITCYFSPEASQFVCFAIVRQQWAWLVITGRLSLRDATSAAYYLPIASIHFTCSPLRDRHSVCVFTAGELQSNNRSLATRISIRSFSARCQSGAIFKFIHSPSSDCESDCLFSLLCFPSTIAPHCNVDQRSVKWGSTTSTSLTMVMRCMKRWTDADKSDNAQMMHTENAERHRHKQTDWEHQQHRAVSEVNGKRKGTLTLSLTRGHFCRCRRCLDNLDECHCRWAVSVTTKLRTSILRCSSQWNASLFAPSVCVCELLHSLHRLHLGERANRSATNENLVSSRRHRRIPTDWLRWSLPAASAAQAVNVCTVLNRNTTLTAHSLVQHCIMLILFCSLPSRINNCQHYVTLLSGNCLRLEFLLRLLLHLSVYTCDAICPEMSTTTDCY